MSNFLSSRKSNFFCEVFYANEEGIHKLEGKYSLDSTDPHQSEIRAPPQPLPYLMPIPPNITKNLSQLFCR